MANINILFPDAQAARVVDAFATAYNYPSTVPGATPLDPPVPNPQSKAQFAKAKVIDFIKSVVKGYEATNAAEIARRAALNAADPDLS